jgi:hypothetical protein
MFPFPIATPQGCNIQTFTAVDTLGAKNIGSWNKPVGVSHVYMMLIGAGGNGNGTTGGGSGSVTVWYGAAQRTPDNLFVLVGSGGSTATTVISYGTTLDYVLLSAPAASGINAGGAAGTSAFAASGFYKATAGEAGDSGNQGDSATTFLSGGAGTTTDVVIANYGYGLPATTTSIDGTFQMQPIIVGVGGKAGGKGGIGCGGGRSGIGGNGMVLIASW